MVDRVVVWHAHDGLSFVADACAVMGRCRERDPTGHRRASRPRRGLCREVAAVARLFCSRLLDDSETVRIAVIDHLLDRLTEARTGLNALSVLDVVDRLHGELTPR